MFTWGMQDVGYAGLIAKSHNYVLLPAECRKKELQPEALFALITALQIIIWPQKMQTSDIMIPHFCQLCSLLCVCDNQGRLRIRMEFNRGRHFRKTGSGSGPP